MVLPLEGRWETPKMVPFDVRKMMFVLFPEFRLKTSLSQNWWEDLSKNQPFITKPWAKDRVKWAWYLKRLGHVMVRM